MKSSNKVETTMKITIGSRGFRFEIGLLPRVEWVIMRWLVDNLLVSIKGSMCQRIISLILYDLLNDFCMEMWDKFEESKEFFVIEKKYSNKKSGSRKKKEGKREREWILKREKI